VLKNPMARAVLVFVVLLAGTFGLIAWQAMHSRSVLCEVCVTFGGAQACREAYGPTAAEARKTAQDNACSFLAAGMTASIRCGNTTPDRVRCDGDPAPNAR
jgi:hypothetical protein